MLLKEISFSLPENVALRDIDVFETLAKRLQDMVHGIGRNSDLFKLRMNEIFKISQTCTVDTFWQHIETGRDIRVVIELWTRDEAFLKRIPVSSKILDHFCTVRPRIGLMALWELTQLLFLRFDRLDTLEVLSRFLIREYDKLKGRPSFKDMEKIRKESAWLLLSDGPFRVAEYAKQKNMDFDMVLGHFGIPQESNGRYLELAKNYYYIKTIEELNPVENEFHPIFSEVVSDKVKESSFQNGLLLGHAVVRTMIDNVTQRHQKIPQNWLQIILNIAGDPRVPTFQRNYTIWWGQIGEPYISHVRHWLSRFDFRLFLEVLKDFAKRSHNNDLQRMFPPREKFLEGLYESDLIQNTRLFVSRSADRYLKEQYKREELPNYAILSDKDKSIIYLNVGGCHIVEGTHIFSIWIYDSLPIKNPITDYNVQKTTPTELGTGLARQYHRERGEFDYWSKYEKPFRITHHPNIQWQHNVMKTLASMQVYINPEKVFDEEDYRVYKVNYGIPSWMSASDKPVLKESISISPHSGKIKKSLSIDRDCPSQKNENRIPEYHDHRVHFLKSNQELYRLFLEYQDNVYELIKLQNELEYRSTKAATLLLKKVNDRIDEFATPGSKRK